MHLIVAAFFHKSFLLKKWCLFVLHGFLLFQCIDHLVGKRTVEQFGFAGNQIGPHKEQKRSPTRFVHAQSVGMVSTLVLWCGVFFLCFWLDQTPCFIVCSETRRSFGNTLTGRYTVVLRHSRRSKDEASYRAWHHQALQECIESMKVGLERMGLKHISHHFQMT